MTRRLNGATRTFGVLRWRIRLTLWLAAAAARLVTVGFALLSDLAQEWFRRWYGAWPGRRSC